MLDTLRKFLRAWGTLCLALFLAVVPSGADAAGILTGKSDVPSVQQVCNPRPATGDIVLPMPGGLHMVLRAVCVPAAGYLDDVYLTFGIGASTEENAERSAAWADRQYKASLLAPFEIADLPVVWGKDVVMALQSDPASAATAKGGLHSFLYFIGKYEVTRGQWRSVMEISQNFKLKAGDTYPMTNISWFEALEFSRRYSEWIMQNHPDYLPFFQQEKRSSFVRLPTETEWEYAARGGHRVSQVERERTRLHPAPEDADMGEYIVAAQYDSKLSGLAPIGTRKPNPLNLHDILGNSAEMVQTPFQLVAAGQLIGNQGGFVIKGGSWRTRTLAGLHPGRRIEAAYYVDGSAQRRDDLGFRVSLGTILAPKDRHAVMENEWKRRSAPQLVKQEKREDVRVMIREVVREVESPTLKQRLAEAEEIASRYHEQVNINEERMMHQILLGASFSLETLANYASRCYQLIKLMDAYMALSPAEQAKQEGRIASMRKEINGFVKGIHGALHYYRNMISVAYGMDAERLLQQLEKLRIQFSHQDGFSRSMGRRLSVVRRHLEKNTIQQPQRTDWENLQDILPDWLLIRLKAFWFDA